MRIDSIMSELASGESLDRREVCRARFDRRFIGVNRFAHPARPLQREPEINSRIRMAGHQLSRPLELTRGVVQTALAEVDDPKIIVRRPVVQVVVQGLPKDSLGLGRIRLYEISGDLSQTLRFE